MQKSFPLVSVPTQLLSPLPGSVQTPHHTLPVPPLCEFLPCFYCFSFNHIPLHRPPAWNLPLPSSSSHILPPAEPSQTFTRSDFPPPYYPLTSSSSHSHSSPSSFLPTLSTPPLLHGLPLYSSSGFDLLSILSRVASRPHPRIVLGPVDMSCAFTIVDLRYYDSPIGQLLHPHVVRAPSYFSFPPQCTPHPHFTNSLDTLNAKSSAKIVASSRPPMASLSRVTFVASPTQTPSLP